MILSNFVLIDGRRRYATPRTAMAKLFLSVAQPDIASRSVRFSAFEYTSALFAAVFFQSGRPAVGGPNERAGLQCLAV